MKKIIIIVIALLLNVLTSVCALNFSKDDFEFLQRYNDASRHHDTSVEKFIWMKMASAGSYFYPLSKQVAINVTENPVSGDLSMVGISFMYEDGKKITEQEAFTSLVVPALYRVLNVLSDVKVDAMDSIIEMLKIDSIEEKGIPDIAGEGTNFTGGVHKDLSIIAIQYPDKKMLMLFAGFAPQK